MPSLSPPSLQDADTLSLQDASTAMGNGRCAPQQAVGAVRHDRAAENLESLAQQAERDGDPTGAAIYRQRAADQYLSDLDAADAIGGCFFDAIGQAQAERQDA